MVLKDMDTSAESGINPEFQIANASGDSDPFTNMLNRVSIPINANFYKNVKGTFKFVNIPNKMADIELEMLSPQAEYYIASILTDNADLFNHNLINGTLKNILNFHHIFHFRNVFLDVFSEKVKFLTAPRVNPNHIINPKTNRRIAKDKRTFKEIYKKMKLLGFVKDISNIETIEYAYKHTCVLGWLNKFISKKIKDVKTKGICYDDIIEYAKTYFFNVKLYTVTDVLIDEFIPDEIKIKKSSNIKDIMNNKKEKPTKPKKKKKQLNIVAHSGHMYIRLKKLKNKKTIKEFYFEDINLSTIETLKNTGVIIDNEKVYNNLYNEIDEKYSLQEYGRSIIKFKSNVIKYDANYKTNEIDRILLNEKCKNVYTAIEQTLKLRGFLTDEIFKRFKECSKIRVFSLKTAPTIKIDQNKSYPSQLKKKNIMFPIPDINSSWSKYNNEPIIECNFYFCNINEYDLILAPYDDIYTGYEVNILKKEKRIKNILSVFNCKAQSIYVNDDLNLSVLRNYIGWLSKSVNISEVSYNNIKGDEAVALLKLYKDKGLYNETTKVFKVISENILVKTGILTNIMIKALTNIDLYNTNKAIFKKSKEIVLTSIKTDCLGYAKIKFTEAYIKIPKGILGKEIGKFKYENIKENNKKVFKTDNYCGDYNGDPPKIEEKPNIQTHKQKDIKKLLKNKQSFQLLGGGGYGKTYSIKNIIEPYLKKNNKKYILTSTTIENAIDIEGQTVQSNLQSDKNYLLEQYNNLDYLIIDESSQLTQSQYKYLEFIRNNTKCNIILSGDEFQCPSIDFNSFSLLISNISHKLTDNNIVRLEFHKNGRYGEDLNNDLQFIRDNFKKSSKFLYDYVKKNFNTINKSFTSDDDINICYYNDTVKRINENNKDMCILPAMTTHKAQGKTIDVNYTIHDMSRMNNYLIYTSLSRAIKKEHITINLYDDYELDKEEY